VGPGEGVDTSNDAGSAAERYDRDALCGAHFEHCGYLTCVCRNHDCVGRRFERSRSCTDEIWIALASGSAKAVRVIGEDRTGPYGTTD